MVGILTGAYNVLTSDFERAKLNFVCVYVVLTFRSSFSKALLGLDRRPRLKIIQVEVTLHEQNILTINEGAETSIP